MIRLRRANAIPTIAVVLPPQSKITSSNRFGAFADDISEASEEDNVHLSTQLPSPEITINDEDEVIEEEKKR